MDIQEKRQRNAEYMRKWVAAHPEWRQRQRELYRAKATSEEFRQANRDRVKAWRELDPDKVKQLKRASYHRNKELKGRSKSDQHHRWKGDAVSYSALHIWIRNNKGAPSKCEHCGTESAKRFEWANVDHKYARNLNDYIRLCTSCHRRHDYATGLSKKGGRRKRA